MAFCEPTLQNGGLQAELRDPGRRDRRDGDFETPDVMVKFTGPDVDLLLANRAELLLALEHVTMEMLRMPSEDHSRISFDANDYRLLRIEELRLSAVTAAEKVKRTGAAVPLQPDEQPRAPRDPPGAAQRDRRAQRKPAARVRSGRWWSIPPAWPAFPSRPASLDAAAPPMAADRAAVTRDRGAAIAVARGRGGRGDRGRPRDRRNA